MSFLVHLSPGLAADLSETVSTRLPTDSRGEGRGSAEILVDELDQTLGRSLNKQGLIELSTFVAVLESVQPATAADKSVDSARRWRDALFVALTAKENDEVMTEYRTLLTVGEQLRPRGFEKLPIEASVRKWNKRSSAVLRESAFARRQLAASSGRHLIKLTS